jgi:hypothetical protein
VRELVGDVVLICSRIDDLCCHFMGGTLALRFKANAARDGVSFSPVTRRVVHLSSRKRERPSAPVAEIQHWLLREKSMVRRTKMLQCTTIAVTSVS